MRVPTLLASASVRYCTAYPGWTLTIKLLNIFCTLVFQSALFWRTELGSPCHRKYLFVACNAFGHSQMNSLNLSFGEETMLRLTNTQFKELITTGQTITDFAPAKDYWIEDDFHRLFLSIDNSLGDYYFEYEPVNDINKFLKNAYLTHFFPKTGKIKLIKDYGQPLADLVLDKLKGIDNIPTISKDIFKIDQKLFLDKLIEGPLNILLDTGNFKGQIACCDCGEPSCSSEYLWAKDFTGLASFHIVGGEFRQVVIFPFKLNK
jgi:hypothetical protein